MNRLRAGARIKRLHTGHLRATFYKPMTPSRFTRRNIPLTFVSWIMDATAIFMDAHH